MTVSPLRESGIEPVGSIAWGTHVCHFFETPRDLIETAVPFLTAGVEQGERCLWLVHDPLDRGAAAALEAIRGHEDAVQIGSSREFYLRDGEFDAERVAGQWDALVDEALRRGFAGLRAIACEGWQRARDWPAFHRYERSLHQWTAGKRILALCSYPLDAVGAADVLDIARTHHMAIAKRWGVWEVLEPPDTSQLHARNRQQAAIAALGQTAIRERDLRVLLSDAAARAAETLGTGRSLIWQLRPGREDLVLRASVGWDELPHDATIPLAPGTPAEYVLDKETSLMIADLLNDRRFEKSWVLREHGIVTMLSAAIRRRERPWGMLSVHSQSPRSFSADDAEFLQSMANVLALAIERHEHEEAQAAARATAEAALAQLHAIQSITDTALGRMAPDDLLTELLARLRQALRTDYAGLLLLDEERSHFNVRAADGCPLERQRSVHVPIASPVSGRIMQEGRALIFTDLPPADAPEWGGWPGSVGLRFRSAMGAPLVVEGKFIGTVVVTTSTERRQFTDAELDLLRVVADRVAPAVERGRLIESIRASEQRFEALSRRLLTVQEEERRRLAVELHDELGQIYTAVKIKLDSVQRGLADPAASTALGEAIEIVQRASGAVRDLALELRPAMLDDLGLAAALRWYADRYARETSVAMHLAIDAVPPVATTVATVCFRVAQEALTNIARHAGAGNVWLELHPVDGALELTVRDDGAGFDVAAARERAVRGESLGLLGMEERVSLASGMLRVTSEGGGGTVVRARVPLA